MKTSAILTFGCILFLAGCNNMNRNGENMTPEGTTTTNSVNSEMEEHRTPAGVDTIASPGSNSMDLKKDEGTSNKGTVGQPNPEASASGSRGKSADKNMQGQEDTHGRSTQEGDNGGRK